MNAVIYTQPYCPYASSIKLLLTRNNIRYNETVIGKDVFHEAVEELFPGYINMTVVAIDGQTIGGYNELTEWLDNRPELLIE